MPPPTWKVIVKRKGYIRKVLFLVLCCGYVVSVGLTLLVRSWSGSSVLSRSTSGLEDSVDGQRRFRRDVGEPLVSTPSREMTDPDTGQPTSSVTFNVDENNTKANCTPRAVGEFPGNFFTLQQTKDGGVVAHIAIALYLFGALAIVCDDYFVSSLGLICDRLHLQEDVAGATFMAAGSSAPEFFTSVIGVFIAKSDVGVGTIVGSAIFNILFIIGACGIFAGMVVKLTWYPLTRDCLFYLVSIAALVIMIEDNNIYWYEAAVLVFLYMLYILVMWFNRRIEKFSIDLMKKLSTIIKREKYSGDVEKHDEIQPLSDETLNGTLQNKSNEQRDLPSYTETSSVKLEDSLRETSFTGSEGRETLGDDSYEGPWVLPEPCLMKAYWIMMMPVKVLMFFTIPDCRRPGIFQKLYPCTFVMSIVWIAGCAYLMVWMVTVAGDALEIPDTVMGLTLLAAGTSVPDMLSSIFVARDGYGDMAVSNSIGSNVFDILICLGLPWLLDTSIIKKGGSLQILSGGIGYSALILLSTVVFLLVAIHIAKWQVNKALGFVLLGIYLIVISMSCLIEMNVFGFLVLPPCDR